LSELSLAGSNYLLAQLLRLMKWYSPDKDQILIWSDQRVDAAEYYIRRLISNFSPELNPGARVAFQRNLQLIKVGVRNGHSHQKAATDRNSATATILNAVSASGYKPYVVSPSPREYNEAGVRDHYSLADLRQTIKEDSLPRQAVIVMTDADYYVDLAYWLKSGRPIIMYTFHPDTVAGAVDDGNFTIDVDNYVTTNINGGKQVRHRIYNYNVDTARTSYYTGVFGKLIECLELFNILNTTNSVAFTVDQFQMGPHRRIVSIVPFARVPLLGSYYGETLEYQRFCTDGKFVTLVNHATSDPTVSIAVAGQNYHVEVPKSDLEAICLSDARDPITNLSDVKRRMEIAKMRQCPIILEYIIHHRSSVTKQLALVHRPGKLQPALHYTVADPRYPDQFEPDKYYGRTYAPAPITAAAVFPMDTSANMAASIDQRITIPQKQAMAREHITQFTHSCATEFVELLVPDAGVGAPFSNQEVVEMQDKPMQKIRARANRYVWSDPFKVLAFMKKEQLNSIDAPRNISGCPPWHTIRLSSYTLMFKKNILLNMPWYAPGRTPIEVAEKVFDIATRCSHTFETDLSRMDGTELQFTQEYIEHACYLRYFNLDDHGVELRALLRNEANPKARNKYGSYSPGYSKLSGSPTTTDGNTIKKAFAEYYAARLSGMTPKQAWKFLKESAILCGDDGYTGNEAGEYHVRRAYTELGFDLKYLLVHTRGQPITLLGRLFLDPTTSLASIQSPRRTLEKLHQTTNGTLPLRLIGILRSMAYLMSDSTTPLVSNWCRCYIRNVQKELTDEDQVPEEIRGADLDLPFFSRLCTDVCNWPQADKVDIDYVAYDLDLLPSEVQKHMDILDQYDGPTSEIPQLYCVPKPTKIGCIVNGVYFDRGSILYNNAVNDGLVSKSAEQSSDRDADNTVIETRNSNCASGPLVYNETPSSKTPAVNDKTNSPNATKDKNKSGNVGRNRREGNPMSKRRRPKRTTNTEKPES
jgi:hypothetical protein